MRRPYRLYVSLSCCLCVMASHASAQSLNAEAGQPLMIEVTPQRNVPVLLPPIQLNLQPADDFPVSAHGPSAALWDGTDDGQTFRRANRDRTVRLLLYGLVDTNQPDQLQNSMPRVSRNMKQFMDGHFASIKKDYFNQDTPEEARLVAGDPSFISQAMTRGIDQKPAKLAGATIPIGPVTIGGGYTWGEKNPILMQPQKKGLIVGATYQAGKVPIQVSYLSGGRDVAGISNGGNYAYDNLMIGASIPLKNMWTMNSTLQYRNDRSRLDNEQQQIVITIGTKIRF